MTLSFSDIATKVSQFGAAVETHYSGTADATTAGDWQVGGDCERVIFSLKNHGVTARIHYIDEGPEMYGEADGQRCEGATLLAVLQATVAAAKAIIDAQVAAGQAQSSGLVDEG